MLKLKENVDIKELIKYGFEEDPINCDDKGDTYYHLNNYFVQVNDDFRITVNMLSRYIDILCLPKEIIVHNIWNLDVLYELIQDNIVEITS